MIHYTFTLICNVFYNSGTPPPKLPDGDPLTQVERITQQEGEDGKNARNVGKYKMVHKISFEL